MVDLIGGLINFNWKVLARICTCINDEQAELESIALA
jgi:hypothetical protein